MTEYETRKTYIDAMLRDAGWREGADWQNEVTLYGMPNPSGRGAADYVLYDDAGCPLAVVEAKRTCVGVERGRREAKLYADCLEKQYGRRPVIFLTNGFETRIIDGQYPERECAAVWGKRDLEKWFNLRRTRQSLRNAPIDANIAGRYYQEAAIRAVCDAFERENRRKALLVMATGSGKTRTVAALCKLLLQRGWIRNILFLADRNSLVTQAKRAFVNLLPDLSVTNLVEEKGNETAHCVFSTYQTMYNVIDALKGGDRAFTCGHFDLVICDEAHRSIYNKYRDIFRWFDAPLIGLTATPKDDIDKNTYDEFDLQNGVPTYAYDLAQAVNDRFLVDYLSIESRLKFLEEGIRYDDLSDADKEAYEATFVDENGELPDSIDASALNEWLFNYDTIRQALHVLMTNGIKVHYGSRIGKTIIFAQNHRHAEKILEVFNKEYPHLTGFAEVIDNYLEYAQDIIDDFSEAEKLPHIAISVDMLDTGIDVPEVLNLMFFKKVRSKAKFWQMIGRGTRLCEGLLDGKDKEKFYIFDLCGNFEFFRMGGKGKSQSVVSLQSAIFTLQAQFAYKLQDISCQTEELIAFRRQLVEDMTRKVRELNRESFAVRQHLEYVDKYSRPENYAALTYEDTLLMSEELAPLILPDDGEPSVARFDALMYGIELASLIDKKYVRARRDLLKKVSEISGVANIPEITAQSGLIHKVLHTDFMDNAKIPDFEGVRNNLRGLMKYLPHDGVIYNTNFTDNILSTEWNESELDIDDLANYKAKAEYYVRHHQHEGVIAKLKGNIPLTAEDVDALERILWSEVGTREDYEAEFSKKPLGEFVREIVGLDMNAAKQAFGEYANGENLDSRQMYFVNQIVEYIVHNGMMKDLSVLQNAPFTDCGSVVEIFTESAWAEIRQVIEQINANASVA